LQFESGRGELRCLNCKIAAKIASSQAGRFDAREASQMHCNENLSSAIVYLSLCLSQHNLYQKKNEIFVLPRYYSEIATLFKELFRIRRFPLLLGSAGPESASPEVFHDHQP
jgi:hypothetical protein